MLIPKTGAAPFNPAPPAANGTRAGGTDGVGSSVSLASSVTKESAKRQAAEDARTRATQAAAREFVNSSPFFEHIGTRSAASTPDIAPTTTQSSISIARGIFAQEAKEAKEDTKKKEAERDGWTLVD